MGVITKSNGRQPKAETTNPTPARASPRKFILRSALAPGAIIMHTAVVDSEGIPPSLGVSIVRFLAGIVSVGPFALGFLMTIVDREHRALHDILASTQVITLDDVEEL